MNRVLSGVQPTGNLHLGNYLGAIKNWVGMQDDYDCMFCIVDLHAITVTQDPKHLLQSTRDTAAAYIACGIDPEKSVIFNQSAVPGHCELSWIFSCFTPLGWLNRMTQFKEKAGKHKDKSCLGLYSYPVLMAADILLYHATHVPVGEDQKQHLELTRDIAGAFNNFCGKEFFKLPEPLILGNATRVMSLKNGQNKMSKSDPSDYARVNLSDDSNIIAKKFKKAKSDMFEGVTMDVEKRPEATNLLNIYIAFSDEKKEDIMNRYQNYGFSDFKKELEDLVVEKLGPITAKFNKLRHEKEYLDDILQKGADVANEKANENLKQIKSLIGFLA